MNLDTQAIVQKLKEEGFKRGASDLFLSSGERPAFKINGEVLFAEDFPIFSQEVLWDYLQKTLTPQEVERFKKEWEYNGSFEIQSLARFRMNAIIQRKGLSLTFRYIPQSIPSFESLDLPESLKKILDFQNGLVIFTGSMGSGKSTSLGCILDLINTNQKKHILTLEDPIEFIYENKKSLVEQREIGHHTQSFAQGLSSSLREATDVILVGELRDLQTIRLALSAAETGNLVFATLHTNGASESLDRLINVFPSEEQAQIRMSLASSLRAVIWQALLRKKDDSGRVPAFEVLFKNYAIANLIREQKNYQIGSVLETSSSEGMISMENSLKSLLEKGLITLEEALNLLSPEKRNDFEKSFKE